MARRDARRRLIVNADDFGRSHSINEAVIRAHREGILTTASLMVNEPAAPRPWRWRRENPILGVGLHLDSALRPLLPVHGKDSRTGESNGKFTNNP